MGKRVREEARAEYRKHGDNMVWGSYHLFLAGNGGRTCSLRQAKHGSARIYHIRIKILFERGPHFAEALQEQTCCGSNRSHILLERRRGELYVAETFPTHNLKRCRCVPVFPAAKMKTGTHLRCLKNIGTASLLHMGAPYGSRIV